MGKILCLLLFSFSVYVFAAVLLIEGNQHTREALHFQLDLLMSREQFTMTPLSGLLNVYFINLDASTERRQQFESELALLPRHLSARLRPHRVSAVTTTDVQLMLSNSTLVLNGIEELIDTETSYEWWDKKYQLGEVACTMSHLKAIKQAYTDGLDFVLIVEDDAVLTAEFLENWKTYSELAPTDWTILHWTTSNAVVNRKEAHKSNDFWLNWVGFHWSTLAYMIRREGMELVLNHTSNLFSNQSQEPFVWKADQPNMLAADELIYFVGGNTYTSSHCWVTTREVSSTIEDESHQSWVDFGKSEFPPTIEQMKNIERAEGIAVIESIRIERNEDIASEIRNLNADIRFLARLHPRSMWFVKVVLVKPNLLLTFKEMSTLLPRENLRIQVEVYSGRFNKFVFVHETIEDISNFDFLLMKDNDIRLCGFEWNTLLNQKYDRSIIRAPYRVDLEGTTARYRKHIRQTQKDPLAYIGMQDASFINTDQDKNFKNTTVFPVMMLEMFMVLMRSDFGIWFFKQVLTPEFLSQDLDWGPDLMWCGAANDYLDRFMVDAGHSACLLVSVNILHRNTRQLIKPNNSDYVSKGNQVIEKLKLRSFNFEKWIEASNRPTMKYRQLRNWCGSNSWKWHRNWRVGDCVEEFSRWKVENYSLPTKYK